MDGIIESSALPATKRLLADLEAYLARYRAALPAAASEPLARLLAAARSQAGDFRRAPSAIAALSHLISLRTEVEAALADPDPPRRSRVERAFLHLSRSLVVDETLREKWKRAFDDGEPACEGLGAVHLLLHGVWAFDVSAVGERTDLVLQAPLDLTMERQEAVEAMVLTEWKRASTPAEAAGQAAEARHQARLYSGGVLGATELRATRYIVVVTADRMPPLDDVLEAGVTYRHVNLAVTPSSPSKAAVSLTRTKTTRSETTS